MTLASSRQIAVDSDQIFLGICRPFNDDSVEKIFANIKRGVVEWPEVGKRGGLRVC